MGGESSGMVGFDLGPLLHGSGKDSKPDSWFLFDLYKRKRNPVTKVQEPVPENVTYFTSSIQNIAQKRLNISIC